MDIFQTFPKFISNNCFQKKRLLMVHGLLMLDQMSETQEMEGKD